jgi:hypothetical protein
MRVRAKDVQTITRDNLQKIICSHTLKPLVKRLSKLLQFRSKGDTYIRDLMFRKSIHPEKRYFRDKWELVLFLRKKILNLKNTLFHFVQQLGVDNTEIPTEDWMAAVMIYTKQKELYHLFYYLRKIELDINRVLLEIKKLRKQIAICEALEVPSEDIKQNMEKIFNKYKYYAEEKKQVMRHVKKIEAELLDKWLFYDGCKEIDNLKISQNAL